MPNKTIGRVIFKDNLCIAKNIVEIKQDEKLGILLAITDIGHVYARFTPAPGQEYYFRQIITKYNEPDYISTPDIEKIEIFNTYKGEHI